MKRLYLPIEKFPVYNNAVDHYMVESQILNGGSETIPNSNTVIWTKRNIEGYLIEIEGNNDDEYLRNNNYQLASIPDIKIKIKEIEDKFVYYQKSQVNQGYEKPEEMPLQMLNEYYTQKARLTVFQAEADELRKRLKYYEEEEQKIDDSKVLELGLRGIAHFHGPEEPSMINVLKEIDGQNITQTDDGLLIINDERSPFSGMSVVDYRALCRVFYDQQKQKENEELKRVQELCRAEGKPIPVHMGVRSPRKVNRASLPQWPDGVKNWLAKE